MLKNSHWIDNPPQVGPKPEYIERDGVRKGIHPFKKYLPEMDYIATPYKNGTKQKKKRNIEKSEQPERKKEQEAKDSVERWKAMPKSGRRIRDVEEDIN